MLPNSSIGLMICVFSEIYYHVSYFMYIYQIICEYNVNIFLGVEKRYLVKSHHIIIDSSDGNLSNIHIYFQLLTVFVFFRKFNSLIYEETFNASLICLLLKLECFLRGIIFVFTKIKCLYSFY